MSPLDYEAPKKKPAPSPWWWTLLVPFMGWLAVGVGQLLEHQLIVGAVFSTMGIAGIVILACLLHKR